MHAQSHSNSHCHHQHLSSNSIPKVCCDRIEISFYYSARSIHLVLSRLAWKSSSFASTFRSRPTSPLLSPTRVQNFKPSAIETVRRSTVWLFFLLENKHLFVNRSRQFFDNFEFTISNSIDLNSSRVFRSDFPRKVERMDLIIPRRNYFALEINEMKFKSGIWRRIEYFRENFDTLLV